MNDTNGVSHYSFHTLLTITFNFADDSHGDHLFSK